MLGYHERAPGGRHGISAVCAACVERAQALPADVVVFTGWSARGGASEAEQMRDLWQASGPELLIEPRARNTAENAARSLRLLLDHGGIGSATVVYGPHHGLRVRYFFGDLFREHGIDVGYERVSRPLARPHVWLRELGAIPLMWHHRRLARKLLG